MKVIGLAKKILEPEMVRDLETNYEDLFDFVKCLILANLEKELAEIMPTVDYLAGLMFGASEKGGDE